MRLALVLYALAAFAFVVLADTGHLQILLWKIETFMPHGDQLVHFVSVGVFAVLATRAMPNRTVRAFGRELALGTVIALALASAEELAQLASRYRTFSFLDLGANALGALAFGELARRAWTTPPASSDAEGERP